MATARDFLTLAFKEAGVLGVGQSMLPEDYNDGLTYLNRMLAQWQKKRWIVPSLYSVSAVGNGAKSNLIGPGQYYNAQRPDKIQAAYFKQLNTSQNNPVSFPLSPIWSWENYAQIALKEMASWPQFFFYDNAFPYGNVYIWPIPDSTYEISLVIKSAIGFDVELSEGDITNPGNGYVNGNYGLVPLVNLTGYGSGGTLDITVSGGQVTAAVIHDPGDGYKIGDLLTVNNTYLGGTGNGFVYTVDNVTDNLDAVFNMPEEYEEAIHYNLAIRLMSAYKIPPNPVTAGLAKLALNTIKLSNAQVPTLKMPESLINRSNRSFYIFNADQF